LKNLNGYLIILGTIYGITEIALFLSLGISRIPLKYAQLLNPAKAWDLELSRTLKIHEDYKHQEALTFIIHFNIS